MICGKLQELFIRRMQARSARDKARLRAAAREHVANCEFCQKYAARIPKRKAKK